jgi:hypothetical protein
MHRVEELGCIKIHVNLGIDHLRHLRFSLNILFSQDLIICKGLAFVEVVKQYYFFNEGYYRPSEKIRIK